MNENEWEEVKAGNYWNPSKEGEEVEGAIISMSDGVFGKEVTIELSDKKTLVLPNHTVLQTRIKNCKIGDYIKVVFDRTELPTVKGYNPTNIYSVFKKNVM